MSTDQGPSGGTPQPAYHHGDLRRTLLAAAVDVIAAEGPAALSLRDLARRAGVSHAAPAHHFKDRTGLLTAVATEAYTLFADSLSEVTDLTERGARYVRFAARHPAHFQVMFQPELYRADDPALVAARERAARTLREGVAGLAPEGSSAEDARRTGIAAWSLAHGFASLLLSHNLTDFLGDRDPEEAFRSVADGLFEG
ncbi:TetR/AcrR family transcriptional regulator [Streptomyces sp. NBC_00102]|uniref:TetR/AcrR family transcriptional regulator n=1 Tax=Streptomyces sp. NBC_00102 TaxID=2975652 RepID=UPI00224E628D|nr:TetR/AcrR family transcriptional regulator [Streptomyces sp. NBC_00102]MCX5399149.1 TetR/AcrR family transcriptional regulator [Streptomyces sp. NBC_00102]